LPACNFTGNLELTFGGARTNASGATHTTDALLQAKTILRPLDDTGWGAGLTLGAARHLQREQATGWGDAYFNVPVSMAIAGERWVAHFNGGASWRRDEKRALATWGFGNEILIARGTYLIPEVFRTERGKPFFQAGVRHWLVKDRLQLDATYGDRFGGERAHWVSIGLRVLTPPFLR
jgi:hypothetical protein